jgi:hypothetical protein
MVEQPTTPPEPGTQEYRLYQAFPRVLWEDVPAMLFAVEMMFNSAVQQSAEHRSGGILSWDVVGYVTLADDFGEVKVSREDDWDFVYIMIHGWVQK